MIEKILERLREKRDEWFDVWSDAFITDDTEDCFYADGMSEAFMEAMKIVQEVAKEYEPCYKDCSECEAYNKEKHHCPKFCKVIAEVVKETEKMGE